MRRLKIALVAHGIHFRGGMERAFAELAASLCKDHEVHLFSAEVDNVPFEHLTVHPISVVKKPIALKFMQFYMKSGKMIKFSDFDIVHTIGGITPRQNVVTAQYCQYAWGDVIAHSSEAASLVKPYHKIMWRYTGHFERQAITSPQTIMIGANSQKTADDLVRFYGCSPSKIKVIYNGVDSVRFTPENRKYRSEIRQRYKLTDDDFVILFVGEYRRKGLTTLIKALSKMNNRDAKILAVGRGDHAFYTTLAISLGVEKRVVLADPAKDIERVFAASDIFAFPTLYEPFGMVITEAMASGLPTITSKVAGASELIEDGKSGLILQDNESFTELANHLDKLIDDSELRCEMGRLGREAVIPYDWNYVAGETLKLYESVINA